MTVLCRVPPAAPGDVRELPPSSLWLASIQPLPRQVECAEQRAIPVDRQASDYDGQAFALVAPPHRSAVGAGH